MFDVITAAEYHKFNRNFEEITICEGEIINDRGNIILTINDSTIKTAILRAVGKNVDNYASDVLYDLKRVDDLIVDINKRFAKGEEIRHTSYLSTFGLRESGVDNVSNMTCRITQGENYYKVYRAVYYLVITIKPGFSNNRLDITMDLFRDKNFNDKEVR